ncbi:anaerobic ribonucleoside-triphosphate reductase activating protein [Arcticibacter sp.]|uniref:anaerobic ribonucleoside-triphosphate reductase activating protein n=1 Tax=Arcticibacter sp. TaxID=1872630 RepID=UPI00388FE116
MHKPIYDITPFSALDYPDKTACIIWFAGCNMRCGYCYNPTIVEGKGRFQYTDALRFLKQRHGLLDGTVLSGGECMLHKDLPRFAREIKDLGLLLKIDTNGTSPGKLKVMITNKLIDYVALDFKAPPKTFKEITGSNLFELVNKSLDVLLDSDLPFEVRTTYHSDLHSLADMQTILDLLLRKGYRGTYFIQNFVSDGPTLKRLGSSTPLKNENDLRSQLKVVIRNR